MANKFVKVASLIVTIAFCVAFVGNDTIQKSAGGPPYNTNAPGEKTCSGSEGSNSCHSGGIADNSGPGTPSILSSGGTTYVPGQTYTITPQIAHPTRNRFGFQIVSLKDSNNAFVGTITLIDTNRTRMQQPTWGSYQDRWFVMHQLPGSYAAAPNLGQWTYKWTAPSYNAGNISFYACFLAANNNNTNDSGDETYWKKITISPSAVGITETTEENTHLSIYPNPCNEFAYLSYYLYGNTLLSANLISADGKVVKRLIEDIQVAGLYATKVDIQDLSPGLYYVASKLGDREVIKKIIIQ